MNNRGNIASNYYKNTQQQQQQPHQQHQQQQNNNMNYNYNYNNNNNNYNNDYSHQIMENQVSKERESRAKQQSTRAAKQSSTTTQQQNSLRCKTALLIPQFHSLTSIPHFNPSPPHTHLHPHFTTTTHRITSVSVLSQIK
jgi:hypothetical protein